MTRLLFIVLLVATMAGQQDPPLGNPNHEEPAPGWFCHTPLPMALGPDEHDCSCHLHRECYIDPETKQRVIVEHSSCRSYCFKSHCACSVKCKDS